ncbi:MAG: hypothetical protein RIS64_2209 [Bacteroidota bacterium]|jgi:hypothetical protein
MSYSKYKKIKTVIKKFNLDLQLIDLFDNITPTPPSAWLKETLRKSTIQPLINEKAKAERIISPILMEIAEEYASQISLFSGENLDVNEDLTGECDFFFALHPPKLYIDAPIITLVEAKDEDMEHGLAQCAAQLYGAKLFNEQENRSIPVLFGCATTGTDWKFIRFENNVFYADKKIYTDISEILGVWHHVIQVFLKK